ncbi:uricase [Penicillium lagena]|uniref:uricase n=1 Tax=Penicillium lagena TaxID=94218 RepID=UPI0025403F30|nr:uricase [Penicillium lagena]KAJ5624997.1 uricase [Penicillium lagena]
MYELSDAQYGKDNVRLYKVHRNATTGVQTVYELTVCVLLEGDIETSYTKEDNSVLVTTDAIKNTVYIVAKQYPVDPPELFGSILGKHFITKYSHIHSAHIDLTCHSWERMAIDNKPHPHSFFQDGSVKRHVNVDVLKKSGFNITSSISGLSVLKSTKSEFWGYIKDEYTTLPETWDRILSSDVDIKWKWKHFTDLSDVESHASHFDSGFAFAKDATFRIFAEDNSMSAQGTLYKMAEQFLKSVPLAENVQYSWPNKHYVEIDLSWHNGIQNTNTDAEVYLPQSAPNGLIKGTLTRSALRNSKTAKL